MQVKVRKAKPADVAQLTKLFLEFNSFEETLDPAFKELSKESVKGFREHAQKGIKGKKGEFILVAETQGKIVGLVYCETKKRPTVFKIKETGFVNDLFISPECRKKGIAKALMKAAEKEFKKRKLDYVCLTMLSNLSLPLFSSIAFWVIAAGFFPQNSS